MKLLLGDLDNNKKKKKMINKIKPTLQFSYLSRRRCMLVCLKATIFCWSIHFPNQNAETPFLNFVIHL